MNYARPRRTMAAAWLPWFADFLSPLASCREDPRPFLWLQGRRKTDGNRLNSVFVCSSCAAAAAAPSRRYQLLKLMAKRRNSITVNASLSLRIAYNSIKEDIDTIAVSIFCIIASY